MKQITEKKAREKFNSAFRKILTASKELIEARDILLLYEEKREPSKNKETT